MKTETENLIEVLVTFPLTEDLIQKIRDVSPRLHITVLPSRSPGEITDDIWRKTEILITERVLPSPEKVPALRWIQFNFAGIDFALEEPVLAKPDLLISTLSGAAAPQVAEYALTMMLALSHRLPLLNGLQRNHDWPPDRFVRLAPKEFRNSTLGLVGYGSIGREIARLVQPWDVKILACKKNVMNPADQGYIPAGLGDPEGNLFTRLYPFQAIKSMIKECDFVVVSVPKTPETNHLIAEEEFTAMKTSAYLVDLSRGGIVKNQALRHALQEKQIAGAVMDVFEQEPLPKDSNLWDLPNLIVTPHIAGVSIHYNQRSIQLICENLKRYCMGNSMLNIFDRESGY
jgi:phosphoglycerate dehydrogenase-like enzyme